MTRLASIVGVATVATLVLLSGCETAVKTDYAKDLEGTWEVTIPRTLTTPATPPAMVPGMTAVTADITRTGTNKGTVSIAVADTPDGATDPLAKTAVSGTIEVTSSKIIVTVTNIVVTQGGTVVPNDNLPDAVKGLAANPQELTWTLTDNKLKISSELLPVLLLDQTKTSLNSPRSRAANCNGRRQ